MSDEIFKILLEEQPELIVGDDTVHYGYTLYCISDGIDISAGPSGFRRFSFGIVMEKVD